MWDPLGVCTREGDVEGEGMEGEGRGGGEDGQLVERGRGDRHSRVRDWVAGTRMQESKSMKAVYGKGEGQGRSRGPRAREYLEGGQG